MNSNELKDYIRNGKLDKRLCDIYVDDSLLDYEKDRYIYAIDKFEEAYGICDVSVFSSPGRSEVGGNHTDHQNGRVLAAAINRDAIAVVSPIEENVVKIISGKYSMLTISLDDLSKNDHEKRTTLALIKGVLYNLKNRLYNLKGFQAYICSDVIVGAGLSSSAAFETIIGSIVSGLFNEMEISPLEIAIAGRFSENIYFGKPCGLMDQMACSVGGLVSMDFKNFKKPKVEKIDIEFEKTGYSLCISNAGGSHSTLTRDYAAITKEMRSVANIFGKRYLRDVSKSDIFSNINEIREKTNDRALLRAIHFFNENERVLREVNSLKAGNIEEFLLYINESGDSSFKYLQNIYSSNNIKQQNISLALAISESILKNKGACRVHGGGFAGTIQAFVPNENVEVYKKIMDSIFGEDACNVLYIRKYGGIIVI